ncbi:MAG: hypothetical protein QNJ01_11785 [Desulfobacterales bacterium]|nr:hypothetical protein [Desulfobacterales bacterium]
MAVLFDGVVNWRRTTIADTPGDRRDSDHHLRNLPPMGPYVNLLRGGLLAGIRLSGRPVREATITLTAKVV